MISENINSETKTNPNILLIVKLKQTQIFNSIVKRGKLNIDQTKKKKNPSLFLIKDLKTQQIFPTYSKYVFTCTSRVQLYPYGLQNLDE